MKIKAKIEIILLLTTFFVLLGMTNCLAVSISLSPSTSTVSPGQSFTVTLSGKDATGRVNISVSGGSTNTSSLWVENNSQSFNVVAGSSGTVSISASGELSSNSGEDKQISASAAVTIKNNSNNTNTNTNTNSNNSSSTNKNSTTSKPTNYASTTNNKPAKEQEPTKSNDSTLKSLSVVEGKISPEFAQYTTQYILNVPNDVAAVNVLAEANDFKARCIISENAKNLEIGENPITITVTAEDGTSSIYTIIVTREDLKPALQSLTVTYIDENGEEKELLLNPEFNQEVLEYNLGDIEYFVSSLNIKAISNNENAKTEIKGNENLKEGKNVITITITKPLTTEGQEETVTYTLIVNKEENAIPPTIMGRIKNIFNNIASLYNQNQYPIVMGGLILAIVSLFGLSIYIIADNKKYKLIMQKIAELTSINMQENGINLEKAEVIQETVENSTIKEDVENAKNKKENLVKGRRFK